jgi:hypothetical protein
VRVRAPRVPLQLLDVGEPGFIRRLRKPDHAGSNPAIQTTRRKGKPTGDGTRLEPGRATSLEGSTPSPSADDDVPVAERPRRLPSKQDRRVRLPPGTLTFFGKAADHRGPVGNRQTTLAEVEGCWGFNSPLGHCEMPWRTSPEWSSPSQGEERGFKSHPGY